MGLDTTHGCWHGPYSAFNRWRETLARAAGIPVRLMVGWYGYDDWHERMLTTALEWAAPRAGGPLAGDPNGPVLHQELTEIRAWLPISWDVLADDPLITLLDHSDCDGEIEAVDCAPLADRLEELLPDLPAHTGPHDDWTDKTRMFIDGLREAAAAGEAVEFQ